MKLDLKKWDVRLRSGLNWLRYEHSYDFTDPKSKGKFLDILIDYELLENVTVRGQTSY